MPTLLRISRPLAAAACAVCLFISGCAVNPVTGRRQLMLVSESQEVAMGQEYDPQLVNMFGLYDDATVQEMVSNIGLRMAASSERPTLPWSFKVVDDPLINAFAVPGGFVYVTRGILAHFGSEAELAAVVGHEIGHITARHTASQMSRQQIAQLGVGVTSVISPMLADLAGIATAGIGILFLKYSRDNERQADDLGFNYMTEAGYDPRGMVDVFEMLNSLSGDSEGGGVPTWLSTHPDPGDRRERMDARLRESNTDFSGARLGRNDYLRLLDGLVFGENPRNGFFREELFLHPDLEFQIAFPAGWQTLNTNQAVMAQSPEEDAVIRLSLSDAGNAQEGAQAFIAQEGVTGGQVSSSLINGLQVASANFSAQSQSTSLRGMASFVEYGGRVYQVLGFTVEAQWSGYQGAISNTSRSFAQLTDRTALSVQPARISIIRVDREMTLRQFNERYPSSVSLEDLAMVNQAEPYTAYAVGDLVKRVVGGLNQ